MTFAREVRHFRVSYPKGGSGQRRRNKNVFFSLFRKVNNPKYMPPIKNNPHEQDQDEAVREELKRFLNESDDGLRVPSGEDEEEWRERRKRCKKNGASK